MPTRPGENQDTLAHFAVRCDTLSRALDEVLTGRVLKSARPEKKKPSLRKVEPSPTISRDAGQILSTMRAALLDDPAGLGALDYYQLKARCRLVGEPFGLALNYLIPSQLRTRDDGDKRHYFLPREIRQKLRTKARRLRRVA